MAGIYLHIPFCKSRCVYCDFHSGTNFSFLNRYVAALCTELEQQKNYLKSEKIGTIYFGGGTPSLLKSDHFEQIFAALGANFDLTECQEITLEANPDDLSDNFFAAIEKFPFNRLSVGIQSFNDEQLRFLRRRHTAEQAKKAILLAQKFGFKNISIDLMFGLPNQTLADWKNTLQQALQLNVCHISAYHLIYEENTPLFQLKTEGKIAEIDEDLSLELFETLTDMLKNAGFEHYEISNFALPSFRSKHNSSYWNGTPYLGVGAAAHSFDGKNRRWNVADTQRFCEAMEQNLPCSETENLTQSERYDELVITALRTSEGLSLEKVRQLFGKKFEDYLLKQAEKHLKNSTLQLSGDHLILTKKGVFVSDGIMSDLLWAE